jgi:hypothetical protein
MTLKTFNIDEKIYKKFSDYCKKNGISMSKKVENFIKSEMENVLDSVERKKSEKRKKKNSDVKIDLIDEKSEHSFMKYC